jgi:glucose/arabinose dehydrogenase
MLYIGMGDGGSGGDPQGNGQNRGTLLGKLLRIDVNGALPYSIPPDNPFVGQAGVRGEIWATGLRNPWRFAFDRATSRLYIADVGQGEREEVNAVSATEPGLNYGWNVMEGSRCYASSGCNTNGLTVPVLEYDHSKGCSITGGFVYRGRRIPEIQGQYFYADFCNSWLRSFAFANGRVTDEHDWAVGRVSGATSFGEDGAGELYICTSGGRVYRIVKAENPRS